MQSKSWRRLVVLQACLCKGQGGVCIMPWQSQMLKSLGPRSAGGGHEPVSLCAQRTRGGLECIRRTAVNQGDCPAPVLCLGACSAPVLGEEVCLMRGSLGSSQDFFPPRCPRQGQRLPAPKRSGAERGKASAPQQRVELRRSPAPSTASTPAFRRMRGDCWKTPHSPARWQKTPDPAGLGLSRGL